MCGRMDNNFMYVRIHKNGQLINHDIGRLMSKYKIGQKGPHPMWQK